MTNQWFRSWHGAPTDPKWRLIAKKAEVPTSLVVSFIWALMDRASQSEDRGSFAGVDLEVLADYLDCECNALLRIVTQCNARNVTCNDRFVSWEKHQPKREDERAKDRVKAHREKIKNAGNLGETEPVTQCNAMLHNVTLDKIREDKNIYNMSIADGEDDPEPENIQIKKSSRKTEDLELLAQVGESWNDLAASLRLPQIGKLTEARKNLVLARAKELVHDYDFQTPREGFQIVFSKIRGSPFLRGDTGRWRADFDFVFKQGNFTKILEGKYENQQKVVNFIR